MERSIGGSNTWNLLTTTAVDKTFYSDVSTSCGTKYDYRVTATNAGGDSSPINIVNVSTPGCIIAGNVGVEGATITYTGGSTTADDAGDYSFTVSYGWSGTVTPSKAGYLFTPTSLSYTNLDSDQTNQDYAPMPGMVDAMSRQIQ